LDHDGATAYLRLTTAEPGVTPGDYYIRFEIQPDSGGTKFLRFGPVRILQWPGQ